MSIPTKKQTLILLTQLKQELKYLTLWQSSQPSLSDMSSTLPFHYDTLTFEQWLQFVFIERISLLIEKNQTLPSEISLLPMAEESFKKLGDQANTLLEVINQLDCLLSGRSVK
jgi:uncharacterized protein YqcC (DUF446 family)